MEFINSQVLGVNPTVSRSAGFGKNGKERRHKNFYPTFSESHSEKSRVVSVGCFHLNTQNNVLGIFILKHIINSM